MTSKAKIKKSIEIAIGNDYLTVREEKTSRGVPIISIGSVSILPEDVSDFLVALDEVLADMKFQIQLRDNQAAFAPTVDNGKI